MDLKAVIVPTLPQFSEEPNEIRATQMSYSLICILSNEHAAETIKSCATARKSDCRRWPCLIRHGRVGVRPAQPLAQGLYVALANQRHIQSLLRCALSAPGM